MTIGFFMFSMGVGSYLSKLLSENLIQNFISIEIAISLVGGISSLLLMMTFPYARGLYEATMFSLIFVIGALVGMEIPLLTGILSFKKSIRNSIADVMSLDYIGALIGSVAFPLLLLPHLGLIRSSFAIGLISIFTALVSIYFFRDFLKYKKLLTFLSLAILALLMAFTVYGSRLTSFAEKHLYFDQIIFKKQTPYQRIVVTQAEATNEHRLFIDGHIQFSGRDEYRYHEALVHPLMSVSGQRKNVLILGGGDGLAAREVLKYSDVDLIHLVDIDPEMTHISRTLPMLSALNEKSLEDPKVTVYNEDAFSFINQAGIKYDRVIIDMPDPHNEAINKLYSKEFYNMIRKRLSDQGIIVSQSSSPFFTHKTFWGIEKTLDVVYDDVLSYHFTIPSFGIWGFNMARANAAIPRDFSFNVDTKFLTNDAMQAAMVFAKDTDKISVPVNSIMEPKLYQLYLDDLKQ